ncbi:MAG: glycosyltransferase [Desulfuromonadaceae bacterium]|nr:glycosyltransferase [Desulfuromonadaceae bacterium]
MNPLKILHVANRAEQRFWGGRYYALQFKINNGFVRNGHNVYWFSDRDIAKTSSIIPSRSFGKRKCNLKLIEVCKNFRPDVIALSHADIISSQTIKYIKDTLKDVRVFQYNIDGLYTKTNIRNILSKLDVVDYTFMTTAGEALKQVSSVNSRACFMPNPVDPSIDIHRNWEKKDFVYDLFFTAGYSKWLDPQSMRAYALKNLPHDPPGARVFTSTGLWGDAFVSEIGRAKMALNFNQFPPGQTVGPGGNLYMGSSDRISLCLGNGLLVFTDRKNSLASLYGKDAVVEVSDYGDFREAVAYYLANDDERIKIARRGYTVAHSDFNERLVAQYMLETLFGCSYSRGYCWPTDKY